MQWIGRGVEKIVLAIVIAGFVADCPICKIDDISTHFANALDLAQFHPTSP